MLTQDQLARLAQSFYNHVLEKEHAARANGAWLTEEGRVARGAYWLNVSEEMRKTLGSNTLETGQLTARIAAKLAGLDWAAMSDRERHQCKEAVHRAGIDLAQALRARYEGDYSFEPRDKLLKHVLEPESAPSHRADAVKPASVHANHRVMSSAYPHVVEDQVQRGNWTQQTANQAEASYELFVKICGDRPLRDYSRSDAGNFRRTAERLPSNYSKAAVFKGMEPNEIVVRFEKLPEGNRASYLTQKTIKRHFSALSALWAEAIATGEAEANIFSDFKFTATKRAKDERNQWEMVDLKALFASPIWSGCLSEGRRTQEGHLIVRDEKFWVPLIGLYSGMRLEEICQLRTDDLRSQDDVYFFDVNDNASRQVKNSNAVRRVPIHPELIKLGFLEYVASFGTKGSRSIFPALKPGGADKKLGHAFTKWFTRYRRDIGVYRPKVDFHSLRHTATTFMHQANVPTMVIDHLTGHSSQGETARYTKGSTLEQLAAAIGAIDPKLDFSHLYPDER